MKTSMLIFALWALCGAAFVDDDGGGQGNNGTDRANRQALVCAAGETAVPVSGPDGIIVWTCKAAGA